MLRAYTRLVTWSVRHRFVTRARSASSSSPARSGSIYAAAAGLPAGRGHRALAAGVELPPGSQLADTRRASPTRSSTRVLQARPEVKSVFVDGGRVLGRAHEVRKATLIVINLDAEDRAQASTQSDIKRRSGGDLARVPRHPLLVPQRERPARDLRSSSPGVDEPHVGNASPRAESRAQMQAASDHLPTSSRRPSSIGRSCASIREAELRGRARRLDRSHRGSRPHRHHRRRRRQPRQVRRRRPAGADPRAARRRARASRQILENAAGADGVTGGRVPLSSVADVRARPGPDHASTATTASAASRSAPTSSARRRSAKRSRRSTSCRPRRTCPPGVEIKQFGDAEIMGEVFAELRDRRWAPA